MASGGMNLQEFKKTVNQIREIKKNYKTALLKFATDLETVQNGKNGEPIWNGTRAQQWMKGATETCYQLNYNTYVYLQETIKQLDDTINDWNKADGNSSNKKSSSDGESISKWDLVN